MTTPSRSFIYAIALALVFFSFSATPVFASNSWAEGGYVDHTNFTSSTVVGLKITDWPYWSQQVAYGGPDNSIAFLLNVFSVWGDGHASNPAWQVGLLARYNTRYMDTVIMNPGDTGLTVTCTKCLDGTTSHTFEISRVTNGWTSYVDGASQQTTTGTPLANDNVKSADDQQPVSMEVASGVAKTSIDGNFRIAEGSFFYYEVSPVGSGTWLSIPHMYAYYTNTSGCANTIIGNVNAPTWAAVNSNGFVNDIETGTTTYLTAASCGSQFF